MNPLTGTLHHPERVGHDDPVVMLKRRLWKVLALLACWQRRATQRRQLMGLDARLLQDVGISHAEALEHGRRPFWRD